MELGRLMESEVRSQPAVLAENCARYGTELSEKLGGQEYDMVLLAARGSSDNAALLGRYLIEIFLGIPVSLAAPSVLTRFGTSVRYPKCLAVGISQSGAAPDVAEVLGNLRAQGHATLAITNTPGSRLTMEAEHSLLLGAGEERSVAATKTYSASLLAMVQLVRALGGKIDDPSLLLPTEEWVEQARESAEASLGPVLRSSILFALGRGYSFCTAQEQALKLMECALLSCKSYSTADFQHGPKALASHGSALIVYGENPEGLDEFGAVPVLAPAAPEGPMGPIWQIIFGQWIALLAARARGLDPDRPQALSKVTLTR